MEDKGKKTVKDEDIIVKRKKVISSVSNGKTEKSSNVKNGKKNKKDSMSAEYERNLKIFAIILSLISILIFISIISYTSSDEASTEISFIDLFGLLKGNEAVMLKAQSTHNWLGLAGAFISNILINFTLGYWIIVLPLLTGLWSFSIYKNLKVSYKVIKITIFSIVLAFLLSSISGALSKISWLSDISKEWIGAVGFFMSSFGKNLLGTVGSLLVFITLIGILIIVWGKISPENIYRNVVEFLKNLYAKLSGFGLSKKEEIPDETKLAAIEKSEAVGDIKVIDTLTGDSDEPARIIRRNLELQINRPEQDNSLVHPFLGRNVFPGERENNSDIEDFDDYDEDISENDTVSEAPDSPKLNKDYLKLDKDDIDHEQMTDDSDAGEFDENGELIPASKTPKLVLTIEEHIDEEAPEEVLSTWIHDEDINYKNPIISLLLDDESKYVIDESELKMKGRQLQEKLETFKIIINDLKITPGPVVTQYEFVPAPGIKISKIESLQDDIAMAMKAKGIRILAPVPGKGTVGIEIPNAKPALVRFSSIVKSAKFNNNEMKLPLALGKTISGEVFVADLAKMPHLLIAGATGSGKSVGMNAIISSLLFRLHPRNLKFVFIDPKKVELRQYAQLSKHFLAVSPEVSDVIITDPTEAVVVLKALCAEMELRYEIMASVRQRNIADYNEKVAAGAYKSNKDMAHRQMPYIVCVIDELADLMLTASKDVEPPIIRLAQLARAVGIHLIVATQRPSVDVITGIIKANFPSRIAFQVASKVDSRTILDVNGADQLLGDGDMLFHGGGVQKPLRIQNSFLTTDEVESLCEFIGRQKGYSQPYMLPALNDPNDTTNTIAKEDRDPLFEDSARLVINHQQASVSLIQRRMKVGYARAGRIIDELEAFGVIGPYEGSKARMVIMESESELEGIL